MQEVTPAAPVTLSARDAAIAGAATRAYLTMHERLVEVFGLEELKHADVLERIATELGSPRAGGLWAVPDLPA